MSIIDEAIKALEDYNKRLEQYLEAAIAVWGRGKGRKPKPANGKKLRMFLIALIFLIIAGGAFYYALVYPAGQEQAAAFHRLFAMKRHCTQVFVGELIDRDISDKGFSEACRQEVDYVLNLYADEIDYCLAQSNTGSLSEIFKDCLAEQGVAFSGTWMRAAR